MLRSVLVLLAGSTMLALSAAPASAQEIFCTVKGAKQGTFQDGSGKTQIPVLFLTEEVTVPTDPATGLPTGRRVNKPLTIVKELDAASIQFFQAAVTNETLPTVSCTFYRAFRNGTGTNAGRAYFRIDLTNASIVTYRDAGDGINGEAQGDERERISFTYQRIELTDLDSKMSALDDWTNSG